MMQRFVVLSILRGFHGFFFIGVNAYNEPGTKRPSCYGKVQHCDLTMPRSPFSQMVCRPPIGVGTSLHPLPPRHAVRAQWNYITFLTDSLPREWTGIAGLPCRGHTPVLARV